ncbi:unnamed protein product [Echinostoma caproni]|uniref:Peptidase S1 domain-containing protein n=1 Tax=Echinostoma caproni TaxID=27848 RepID=A0A183AMB5_9TREM|nr:unnamed protein product [Echinostoma caproni]
MSLRHPPKCVQPSMIERVKGVWNRLFNYVFGQVKLQTFYHVKEIFHHPRYVPGTLEYDLALLQLKEEPVLRKIKNIGLIALPDRSVGSIWPHTNQTCLSVGWGCSFADGPPTMRIQSVELPVLDPETCRNMYSAYINLTTSHEFCAGYHMGNKGICPVSVHFSRLFLLNMHANFLFSEFYRKFQVSLEKNLVHIFGAHFF